MDDRLPSWAASLPLPMGLAAADRIVAVSPGYAGEILTEEFGAGLDGYLHNRSDVISGILNGLDLEAWDPETDKALHTNFALGSLKDRQANKLALQNTLGFLKDPKMPLLGMITRMDYQKGIDMAIEALAAIADQEWQAVILGTGDPQQEGAAAQLAQQFPEKVRAVLRFDGQLARQIYAGADMHLIPSRYEPCGLTQMIAMRYGCVPLGRATGGLRDTIIDYHQSPATSTGFLYEGASGQALADAIVRGLGVYYDGRRWQGLQRRGMKQDFSWEKAARLYYDKYIDMLKER
jgi:starch synthase